MPNLVGIGLSQVPTNSMLGGMAYQDPEHASIKELDLKNLSQINSEIADTAVDIFVYDTRKDSDGGAWRKRTQNTSWYNETLGTSTRGTRKEFPAVAVIVAESLRVTIYDGDDPDLPMWMVFHSDGGNCMIRNSGVIASVTMLNAELCVGRTSGSKGLGQISFITEVGKTIRRASSGYLYLYKGNIEQRNDSLEYANQNDITQQIKGDLIYDVAMTVLPNAPVDSATGLPIPTIAVATDQGISVLKDSGSIVDMYPTGSSVLPVKEIYFTKSNKLAFKINNNWTYYYQIPSSDISATYWNGLEGFIGRFTDSDRTWATNGIPISVGSNGITYILEDKAIGHTNGVDIIDINEGGLLGSGMHAGIATNFNTGYMHGDIKGAFLSDTDTTNVTSSNLISGATYSSSSRITSYSYTNGSNTLVITDNPATADGYVTLTLGGLTPLTTYVVTVTANQTYTPTTGYNCHIGSTADGTVYFEDNFTGTASQNITFKTASSGSPGLVLYSNYNGALTYTLDLRLAEFDRSVGTLSAWNSGQSARMGQKKELAIYGTVTKTPVATGADLVAYSGFSASNYLKQPYNSDLDFGTDDFYVGIWSYGGSDAKSLIIREEPGTDINGSFLIFQNSGAYQFYIKGDGQNTWTYFSGTAAYGNYWSCVYLVRSGNTLIGYVNGKQVGSTGFTGSVTNNDAEIVIGTRNTNANATQSFNGSLALAKVGAGAPSPEQIKKIYEDEKYLFQENAKATLYGSSDAVTALAYDDTTNLLHAGTSAGRSEFQGLRRINNTTTAVTTAISASNGLVAEQ